MTTTARSRQHHAEDRWWALVAPGYDRAVALVGWHRQLDALVDDVTDGVVLDLGCGPAHLATSLLGRGVDYVGMDRNPAMVARAQRAIEARGRGHGLVVRAEAAEIPFRSASFDVVVATGVLGLLSVPARRLALQEVARVSRGDIRLIEPVIRPEEPVRVWRSRIVALVRDRPVALEELIEAGLEPEIRGSPVLAGVYSIVHATKR